MKGEKYRAFFDYAPDVVFIVDESGRILDANYTAVESYGYSKKELLAMKISDLRAPGEKDFTGERAAKALAGRQVYETVHVRKDGSRFPVEISARGIEADGKSIVILARDISRRRRSEEERDALLKQLEVERKRLSAVIENMPVGVRIAEAPSGRVVMANRQVERIYKRPIQYSENIEQYGEWSGYHADGSRLKGEEWPLARSIMKGEEVRNEEIFFKAGKGPLKTMEVSSVPIRDKKGRIVSAVAVFNDVTGRKDMEKRLEESRKTAELYLDLLSHDVNNINQGAMGFIELALGAETLDEAKELASRSMELLESGSRLIDNIRKLEKAKSRSLKYHPVDLCEVLEALRKQYSTTAGREVAISFSPGRDCLIVANDLIWDVFSNLVGNAIKHSDPGKPLHINIGIDRVEETGKTFYRAWVEDDGPGVPDELKDKLFLRLQRGRTKASGRGLGLYLVKTLAEDYGGRVWVEDRVPGDYTKGARFVVLLPAARGATAEK